MGTYAMPYSAQRNNSLQTQNAFYEKSKNNFTTFTDMRASLQFDRVDHGDSRVRLVEYTNCTMNDNRHTMMAFSKNKDPVMAKSLSQESQSLFIENASQGHHSQKCGNYDEALAYFRCALLCKRSSIANEPLDVQLEYANILFNVGLIYMQEKGNFSFSSEAFQQCLDLRAVCLGDIHIDVSTTMYFLAKSLIKMENNREYALELLNESLSILLIAYPSNFNGLINVWKELALTQFALGAIEDAESSMREVRHLTLQAKAFM